MKTINPKTQEAQKMSNTKKKMKTTSPRHIIIKLPGNSNKEKNLKGARE